MATVPLTALGEKASQSALRADINLLKATIDKLKASIDAEKKTREKLRAEAGSKISQITHLEKTIREKKADHER